MLKVSTKRVLPPDMAREMAQRLWEVQEGTGFSVAQLARAAQVSHKSLTSLLDLPAGRSYTLEAVTLSRLERLFKAWEHRRKA